MSTANRKSSLPHILVLDVGSSSVRATFFDTEARSLPSSAAMRRRYRWQGDPPGAMTFDAPALAGEIELTIDAAAQHAREKRLEVVGVACAAFWHSLLGLDQAGAPVTPILAWGDTRASDVALELREKLDETSLHRRTGCFLHPSYPLVKLAWLRREDPGAFARAAAWVSFPEYLEERFLGVRRSSISMASGSGLLNVHREEWDDEALAIAGITADQLPRVVDAPDRARGLRSDFAARWPELDGIPWFPALGDGACANAGSGAVGEGWPGLTIGTSAAVRALWQPSGPVEIPEELWCYRLDRRWWVAGGALSNGGGAVAFLRRTLALGMAEEVDKRVAALAPAAHGLTILPFLRAERGPGWLKERAAVTMGLREETPPEAILQGWMEAVGYRIARVVHRLEEVVGRAERVVASGGALHSSPAWVRILTDTLDRPVSLSAEREETSRGAALLALESLGLGLKLKGPDTPATRVLHPDPDAHARHVRAMDRQQRLLETIAPLLPAELDRGGPT